MARPVLARALVAHIARGGSYRRTAAPEVVLAELAALPGALAARERTTQLALAIAAVPLPLALVPLGRLLDAGLPPQALWFVAAVVAVIAWLVRQAWEERRTWWIPAGVPVLEHVVRALAWKPGSDVSVVASRALGGRDDLVLWSIEGELASGARLSASLARDASFREARQDAVLEVDERRPWALARAESALLELGFAPAEQRITASSIGWSRVVPRSAEAEPGDVVANIARLLETLPDERRAAVSGYRDAPTSGAPVSADIAPARAQTEAWAARAWAAVLAAFALGIVVASARAIAMGRAPSTLLGGSFIVAGVVTSVSLACWLAQRLVRDARGGP